MRKIVSGLVLVATLAEVCLAAEGRWILSLDKRSGKDVALLQTESKGVLKVLPLDPHRTYSPVSSDQLADKKNKSMAKRGVTFVRLTAKNTSATPIDGGRLLVLQEQTIVMPPQPGGDAGKKVEPSDQDRQEPEDNSIFVSLYDQSGKLLWSRKYGPMAGRLPMSRDVWAIPNTPDLPFLPGHPADAKEK